MICDEKMALEMSVIPNDAVEVVIRARLPNMIGPTGGDEPIVNDVLWGLAIDGSSLSLTARKVYDGCRDPISEISNGKEVLLSRLEVRLATVSEWLSMGFRW